MRLGELEMQDQALGELSESVSNLHRLGHQIRDELDEQGTMLEDVEHGMDENLESMSLISRQTSALVKRAGQSVVTSHSRTQQ